jgi:hypothetical protein
MADKPDADQPQDEREDRDLKDSAKSIGVEDADRMDPEEVVDAVQHTQTDSESSPSGWKAEREEEGEDA